MRSHRKELGREYRYSSRHRQQADTESRTLRNYIGGGWVEAAGEETLEDRNPATGELDALVPLSGRRRRRRRGARRPRGAAGVARGGAAEARPCGDGAARGALGTARGHRPAGHRRHGQDPRRRPRRGPARDRVDRGGLRDPAPAQGREPRGRRRRRRRRARAPAGRRRRRDHPVQLPGDDPALVPALSRSPAATASSSSRRSAIRARRS